MYVEGCGCVVAKEGSGGGSRRSVSSNVDVVLKFEVEVLGW